MTPREPGHEATAPKTLEPAATVPRTWGRDRVTAPLEPPLPLEASGPAVLSSIARTFAGEELSRLVDTTRLVPPCASRERSAPAASHGVASTFG